jgi:predicted NBD/HSP70 family sugar kinase
MSTGLPAARAVLDEAVMAAGVCTANACTLFNPRAVVLGGGVIDAWPEFARRIEAFVRTHCSAAITRNLVFCDSRAGSDAILIGAAAAARSHVSEE